MEAHAGDVAVGVTFDLDVPAVTANDVAYVGEAEADVGSFEPGARCGSAPADVAILGPPR